VTVNQHGYDRTGRVGPGSSLPGTALRTLLISPGIPEDILELRKRSRLVNRKVFAAAPGQWHLGGPVPPAWSSSSLDRKRQEVTEGRVELAEL